MFVTTVCGLSALAFTFHSRALKVDIPLPEVGSTLEVINIQQINTLIPKLAPDGVPGTDRPSRLVPVTNGDTLGVGNSDLALEKRQLSRVEGLVADLAKDGGKVGTGDRTDIGSDVAKGRVEGRDWSIVKVITRADTLDLVERGVASADDCDGSLSNASSISVVRQPATSTKRLQGFDNIRPGGGTVGLDVDEEIQSLGTSGIVDAIVSRSIDEW